MRKKVNYILRILRTCWIIFRMKQGKISHSSMEIFPPLAEQFLYFLYFLHMKKYGSIVTCARGNLVRKSLFCDTKQRSTSGKQAGCEKSQDFQPKELEIIIIYCILLIRMSFLGSFGYFKLLGFLYFLL